MIRELVILNSSSLASPSSSSSSSTNPQSHHHHYSSKPKPSLPPNPNHRPSSKPTTSKPSLFLSSPTVGPVPRGIADNALSPVLDALKAAGELRVPPAKLLDGLALDSIRKECLRLVASGDVEQVVPLMETLSGFGFPIKELAKPSDIVRMCIEKRAPEMAVRYAAAVPNERMLFCTIINEFGKRKDLDSALTAYEAAVNKLSTSNMYLHRTIIDVCGRCGDYMASRYIFEDLLNQEIIPNIYVVNSLVNANAHDLGYILLVYRNMKELGVMPDVTSYNILLKACSLAGRVDLAQDIYREAKQLESTGVLKLDVFTYCTIIKVFADAKLWQMALKVKEDMLACGITPNMYTWSSLISACANAGVVEQAIKLFDEMLMAGIEPNPQCCNILLHACVEACQYDRAFRLFQFWKATAAQEVDDDNRQESENRSRFTGRAVSNTPPFKYLRKIPFKPTLTTYNTVMKACGSDYVRAKGLMEEMKAVGLVPDHISWTTLIEVCGASGNAEGAMQIIKNMRKAGLEPDVIAYTNAIKVCVESRNLTLAFALFRQMKSNQIKPNSVTYSTLLKARTRYGSLNEIQQCLAVYQDMRKAGYKANDYYLNQLIEEWCEGLFQTNNRRQYEISCKERTDSGKPQTLLLERVAVYLQTSNIESLAIDLQGLTQVEARLLVLAVLRKIKESHDSGDFVKDDMWITLGIDEPDAHPDGCKSEVRGAMFQLLKKDLGLEVLITEPRLKKIGRESPPDACIESVEGLGMNREAMASPRRPPVYQRLKVTRQSLHNWLQRKVGNVQR